VIPSSGRAYRLPLRDDAPLIMGVLNITPDSFSDGGSYPETNDAVTAGLAMAAQGAEILDIGGESTRPGANRITAIDQIGRTQVVISGLRQALDDAGHESVHISIDTTLAPVAQAALDAGAGIINDISSGTEDPAMMALAADRCVPLVLTHMQGEPGTMQQDPTYQHVVDDVARYLSERAKAAIDAGVSPAMVVIDPGIGFGKRLEHNLALLAALDTFVEMGFPTLLGASRKAFIGHLSFEPAEETAGVGRTGGTVATTVLGYQQGVRLFRVHDVRANHQALAVAQAIDASKLSSPASSS